MARRVSLSGCLLLGVALSFSAPAGAVVMHPGGEMPAGFDRPSDQVVGRWSSNASFVVISPSFILTTRHQGTNPSTVVINGVAYTTEYRNEWTGGPGASAGAPGTADLRLVKLIGPDGQEAQLSEFASIYAGGDETAYGTEFVLGGYGRTRGANVYDSQGNLRGYAWSTGSDNNNLSLNWATNRVNATGTRTGSGYTSDVLLADFDPLGSGDSTPYEGIAAQYDSGGGWFVESDNQWYLVGLTRGVSMHPYNSPTWPADGESWFCPADAFDAVNVSSDAYRAWINNSVANLVPEPATAALVIAGAGLLLIRRRARRFVR